MYYLLNNWSAGIFNNCKYTANGLEVAYTQATVNQSTVGLTSSNPTVTIKAVGNKISLYNASTSSITTTISGKYDNQDYRQEYKIAVSANTAADPKEYTVLDPKYFVGSTEYQLGTISFSFTITIPAGKEFFVIATSGQLLGVSRFYTHRVPPASSSYITELFRVKKTESIATMFLPLIEGYDLTNPKVNVPMIVEVASFANNTGDGTVATWVPIKDAVTTITAAKPYFRFKVTFPQNKIAAVSKIGYGIATNFAYSEPITLSVTKSDVDVTAYRPNFKVFIGYKDYTRYVESCSAGNMTLNLRKVEEDFTAFYYKKVTVYLDGIEVDGGVITRINRSEYPNSVSYGINYTSYRELLGSSYVDNTFAFNSAQKTTNTLPFTNEFEFINYIVNYSPASNGVIINTDYSKEFRSFKFWTDEFSQVDKTGGMGFSSDPDKWIQNYISNQKMGLEVIEQVANANMLTAEVTHSGNLILSELIPSKNKTLGFGADYHKDATSLLSVATHRYNDYSEDHLYIPDYRLYTPDVSYDAIQAGAIIHVSGTTGLGQSVISPEEQDIGVMRGFDTGKAEYVSPGETYNYKTQLTYREPRDKVNFTFVAKNTKLSNLEQTALVGVPKIKGLENTTYTGNAGNVIQPSILSAEFGVKLEHRWLSSTLDYIEETDSDDVYGVTQLALDIWTDDLKDEPARQTGLGLLIGIGIALLIGAAIMVAGPASIPFIGSLVTVAGTSATVGAAAGAIYWGALVGAGAALGAGLGYVSGTSSKVDVMLPIKVQGIPAIKAHQESYVETPLIALPEPKYFPKWAPKAYQEILLNKQALGTETRVVSNPYVVNLSGYKPVIRKDGESIESFQLREERNPYRSDLAQYVASGLTLKEWLRGRTVTLKYIGNPNWFPNQFIAVARQPNNIDNKIEAFEYFYTLGAQSSTINVGGDTSTEIQAAYIGTGYLNHTTENTDIRHMNLLGD